MPEPIAEVSYLSVEDLKQRLDRGDRLALLDVREEVERAFCSIPVPPTASDLHIPMNQLAARFDDVRALTGSAPLVVYCHHGVRSMSVASWLARRGVGGVHNLEGGIDAWSKAIDPGLPRY